MFRRFLRWCFANPMLFWAIVNIGGLGDAYFLYYYFC